jgi:acetyl-CoA carboxylase carboxyltransferase component
MPVLKTKLNTNSPSYKSNYEAMKQKVAELADWMRKSQFQGEDKYIQRTKVKGKLLARERIELVLDSDAPFLELMPLAGWGTDDFCLGYAC